jgi:hypothetical protein
MTEESERRRFFMMCGTEPKSMHLLASWAAALCLWLIVPCAPATADDFVDGKISGFYGDGSAGALIISVDTDWTKNPPASNVLQFERVEVRAPWTIPSGLTINRDGTLWWHTAVQLH